MFPINLRYFLKEIAKSRINNISFKYANFGRFVSFFHVEKGALITDHVEYKLPITFHGGTPNHVSRRKKDINHNSR